MSRAIRLIFGCCSSIGSSVLGMHGPVFASLSQRRFFAEFAHLVWRRLVVGRQGGQRLGRCSPCLRYEPTHAPTVRTHRFPIIPLVFCGVELGSGWVLVMDNAPSHKPKKALERHEARVHEPGRKQFCPDKRWVDALLQTDVLISEPST